MSVEHNELKANILPWLIFKLQNRYFAVNSGDVTSIFQLEQEVTAVPGYSENVRGIINLRGDIIPVLELRRILEITSFEKEHQDFSDMLDMRKQDHVNWVNELQNCIESSENCSNEFSLATDPHKCAFGKWYYSYKAKDQTVAFQLNKIEDPHSKLHETAVKIFECKSISDTDLRKQKVNELMTKAKSEYMPTILSLIDETKCVLKTSHREMCIVLTNEGHNFGILVDEVCSVEEIEFVGSEIEIKKMLQTDLVKGIAQCTSVNGQILVLSKEALCNESLKRNEVVK
ncbi:MAG: chemotaxis protein CheW [Anaerotignaceae bacterium]